MSESEIYEIVSGCRCATLLANAFRRALGIAEVWVPIKLPAVVNVDAYDGIMECIANKNSPMDGRW